MNLEPIQIQADANEKPRNCVVAGSAKLLDVVKSVNLMQTPYLLVSDEAGHLLGIADAALIQEKFLIENEMERQRWMELPISTIIQWKITEQNAPPSLTTKVPDKCTAVRNQDGLLALMSDDDVYVSWQAVRESLNASLVDSMTGLPTRKVFEKRLQQEVQRARDESHSLAAILFDIDHFKDINDMHGHSVGDAAIGAIGHRLQELLRSYDVLARYGGDEFIALCCRCGPNEIDIPINRVIDGIQKSFLKTAVALPPITLSIGAAVIHQLSDLHGPEDLIELADMCLYRAKEDGRNCAYKVEIYDDSKTVRSRIEPHVGQDHRNLTAFSFADSP